MPVSAVAPLWTGTHLELGPFLLLPPDLHLRHGHPQPLGNADDLHVEAPPLQPLVLEEREGRLPREELEPALRVPKRGRERKREERRSSTMVPFGVGWQQGFLWSRLAASAVGGERRATRNSRSSLLTYPHLMPPPPDAPMPGGSPPWVDIVYLKLRFQAESSLF